MTNYFYAWKTASDFASGETPVARATTHDALRSKVAGEYNQFFTAFHVDGTWVDLWTFGPGDNTSGREVSEARSGRYVRARARKLEEEGRRDVSDSVPIPGDSDDTRRDVPAPEEAPVEVNEVEKEKFTLNIDPAVVKAIYEFLALDEGTRNVAITALSALSVSAEPFKSAVEVMLDDSKELTVGFIPLAQEATDEG